MFSGIIHHHGIVLSNVTKDVNRKLVLCLPKVRVKKGGSIAVNGVCLTVVKNDKYDYTFDVMPETLHRTTLGSLNKGDKLHIETSMKLGDEIGGHFVTGHVDTVLRIVKITSTNNGAKMRLAIPKIFRKFVIKKGSVALDGVSLTVANCGEDWFEVALIPYTLTHTHLGQLSLGDSVNVEFDMLGKYALKSITT